MIDERQGIQDAIYDWVAAVVAETGRTGPVIWNHGDGPRPKPPFVSLEFTGCSTLGSPEFGQIDDNGVRTISRPVRRSLTMYGFGERALDLLETIKESLHKDVYQEMLAKHGLVVPQAFEVQENPTVRSGITTEFSALFEFYVTYIRTINETVDWFKTVIITPHGLPMEKMVISREEANKQGGTSGDSP